MTSLCGVSPILHHIKNREPEEHTDVGPGFRLRGADRMKVPKSRYQGCEHNLREGLHGRNGTRRDLQHKCVCGKCSISDIPLPRFNRLRQLNTAASVTSSDRGGNGGERALKRLPVFHRLRPPDELHRNRVISGAQIRRGETRQDLKIPTVSDGSLPRALSCSHREVYPLQTAVRWRFLIPALATGFLVGGSLQAGLYARTPLLVRLPRLVR